MRVLIFITLTVILSGCLNNTTGTIPPGGAGNLVLSTSKTTLKADNESVVVTVSLVGSRVWALKQQNILVSFSVAPISAVTLNADSCVIPGNQSGQNSCSVVLSSKFASSSNVIITASAPQFTLVSESLTILPTYLFIASNTATVINCPIDDSGKVAGESNCQTVYSSTPLQQLTAMTLNKDATAAYLSGSDASNNPVVVICNVSESNLFTDCESNIITINVGSELIPAAMALSNDNKELYIANNGNVITACDLNDQSITSCNNYGYINTNGPSLTGITINANMLYAVNGGAFPDSIMSCTLNNNLIMNCNTQYSSTNVSELGEVVFNQNNQSLYIGGSESSNNYNGVFLCPLNESGTPTLTSCNFNLLADGNAPVDSLAISHNDVMLYISYMLGNNLSLSISSCNLSGSGEIGQCSNRSFDNLSGDNIQAIAWH